MTECVDLPTQTSGVFSYTEVNRNSGLFGKKEKCIHPSKVCYALNKTKMSTDPNEIDVGTISKVQDRLRKLPDLLYNSQTF